MYIYVIAEFTASRILMEDVKVLENIGTLKINISRYGDLSVRSEAVLTSRPTNPLEAGKIFVLLHTKHRRWRRGVRGRAWPPHFFVLE